MKTYVIVLAGGSGTRMGASVNKVLLPVAGVPALMRSVRAFIGLAVGAVLVVRPEEQAEIQDLAARYGCADFVCAYAAGGATRQASVAHGLDALPETRRPCWCTMVRGVW